MNQKEQEIQEEKAREVIENLEPIKSLDLKLKKPITVMNSRAVAKSTSLFNVNQEVSKDFVKK